jgi:steroid 5-alpha reductase family enzyme
MQYVNDRIGGYAIGGEDYRWVHVRKMFHPVVLEIFNFVFVAVIQNFLLLAIALPALVVLDNAGSIPIGLLDVLVW